MSSSTNPLGVLVLSVLVAFSTAAPPHAQQNPGFESGLAEGWRVGDEDEADGEHAVEIDTAVVYAGAHSLRVSQAGGSTLRVRQTIARHAISGDRILLGAYLKTEEVASGYAGLWLRVAGADEALYFDSMRDRGIVGSTEWAHYEIAAPFPPEATSVSFGPILRGAGTAWFDEFSVRSVATAQLPLPSRRAAAYLERALDIMQTSSVRKNGVDWARFRSEVMQQARGAVAETDAYMALQYALRKLGDGHSFLMTPERADAVSRETFANARTGRTALEPQTELLPGGVGYVWLPGFSGGTHEDRRAFATDLQARLAELDALAPCGWIVDLRDNDGGNLWPMLAGIGPLLGDGEAGAAVYPDGRRVSTWYRDGQAGLGDFTQLRVAGEAYRLRADAPPVAILTGRETASSGELIAIAFRGRPHTRTFGEATRGISSATRTFPLSDGAQLILAVATTSDRAGQPYEAAIAPDVPVGRRGRDGPLVEQPVVEAAVQWLVSQRDCPVR